MLRRGACTVFVFVLCHSSGSKNKKASFLSTTVVFQGPIMRPIQYLPTLVLSLEGDCPPVWPQLWILDSLSPIEKQKHFVRSPFLHSWIRWLLAHKN
jgi:hypothetical protein